MNRIHFDKIDSTNSYLKREFSKLPSFTFIDSNYQSEGRGRLGRQWDSKPNENLMFSILLKEKEFIDKFESISLLIGVSVLKTLKSLDVEDVSIKWPNDVYVKGKKICGILLESVNLECLIIGIGLNVNQKDFNNLNATSIHVEKNEPYSIDDVKDALYDQIIKDLNELKTGSSKYLDTVNKFNYLENKKVLGCINNVWEEVEVKYINKKNHLIALFNGKEVEFYTDEIRLIK